MVLKNNNKIKIKKLVTCPEYIPLVSKWLWKEWAKRHQQSLKEIIYRTEHSLKKDCPQILIAFYNNRPVGTVSFLKTDHPYRQDLGPWLSFLFVLPKYRDHKIGQILQIALLKTAKNAGFKKVYLMTNLENYYEKLGWKFIEKGLYTEGRITKFYEHQT